jgi:DNA-binding NarL/FixJ family response regulator
MPLVSGMEATRQIRDRLRQTEVLIFTIHEDERRLDAGARGYVLKSDNTEQLLDAIVSLAEHKPFFTTIVSEALLRASLTRQRRGGIRLSDWERTMVQLIIEGHTNRQVANIDGAG